MVYRDIVKINNMLNIRGEFLWPFFIPALILGCLVGFFTYRNLRLILSSVRVQGTIMGFETRQEKQGSSTLAARVTFLDQGQNTQELLARVRSNPPSGKVGDRVPVYYNPANPKEARLGTFMELWLHVLVLFFLFGVFFIIWFGQLVGPQGSDASHPRVRTTRTIERYGSGDDKITEIREGDSEEP